MMGLMESHNIRSIKFSPTALREGMLDFMVKNQKTLQSMEESNLPDVSMAKL
jgi:exopolyphosphatase/pppGpp-phosphohydrolase